MKSKEKTKEKIKKTDNNPIEDLAMSENARAGVSELIRKTGNGEITLGQMCNAITAVTLMLRKGETRKEKTKMKKYELTDEKKTVDGIELFRIRALRDFTNVSKGDIGGWVQSELNLSQEGDAWVSGNANVYEDAWISGNARVSEDAEVYGEAHIYGHALVCGNAKVCDNAEVNGSASVKGSSHVYGNAQVFNNARVYGNACVSDNARISDYVHVYGHARISGNAWVCGSVLVGGNARVSKSDDYIVFKNSWSSNRFFTYTSSNMMWTVGCFYGTGKELIAKAHKDSELSGRCYEAIVRAVETIEKAKREAAK